MNTQTKLKVNTTNARFEPLSQPDKLSKQILIKHCNEYTFCTYKVQDSANDGAAGNADLRFCEGTEMMDEARLADELNELVKQFGGAADPTSKRLELLAKKAEVDQKELQASVDCLRESLDYLRVCIKYLLLDIEATRRENDYLQKLLKDKDRGE